MSRLVESILLSSLILLVGAGCRDDAAVDTAISPTEAAASSAPATQPRPPVGPFIRVLGTAQDGGFPHASCHGPRCRLAREQPERRRLVASLALVLPQGGGIYLVDVTPDVREQLDRLVDLRNPPRDRVDRSPVDGVFLTHAHMGHYLGLAFFGFEAINTSGLPVRGTPRMMAFLRSEAPWGQLVELGNIEPIELSPSNPGSHEARGVPLALAGDVAIEAILVPHRDEYTDTVAYRIEGPARTVLYVPDSDPWSAWPRPLEEVLAGVDIALLDGSFYSADELPGRNIAEIRHPLMTDTMDRLQEMVDRGELEVYFTHLNHSNPVLDAVSAERLEIESRGFGILEDLDEISL